MRTSFEGDRACCIAQGRIVSIETTVTMNKVTDNFLSEANEPKG